MWRRGEKRREGAKSFFRQQSILCQTCISFAQLNSEWRPVGKVNAGGLERGQVSGCIYSFLMRGDDSEAMGGRR